MSAVPLVALLVACAAPPSLPLLPPGPTPGVATTVYLVGDAGEARPGDPVLTQLALDVRESERRSGGSVAVAYLGDNVYDAGVRSAEPGYSEDTLKLAVQAGVIRGTSASAIFIPGNHDWDGGGRRGLVAVREQQAWLEMVAGRGTAVRSLPRAGCPGPETVDLPEVRLIALDTQWFLHRHEKGGAGACGSVAPEDLVGAIAQAIDGAGGREVVVLSHHPLRTEGSHGGRFPLDRHLFPAREHASWAYVPLPVLGSLYVLARNMGITDQDLSGADNRSMRRLLEEGFRKAARPPLVHAAGHEHSLQVLRGEPDTAPYLLVSGSASHSTAVAEADDSILAAALPGYMRLEVTASVVRVTVMPLSADPSARTGWCGVIDRATRALRACS